MYKSQLIINFLNEFFKLKQYSKFLRCTVIQALLFFII